VPRGNSLFFEQEDLMDRFHDVSEAELALVQGGGLFDWLGDLVGAVEGVLRFIGRPWT
jgi:hypothetical protein